MATETELVTENEQAGKITKTTMHLVVKRLGNFLVLG